MTRQRLPNRRHLETRELGGVNGGEIKVSVGWDEGRPLEVFLTGAKDGSELGAILDDIGVVISVALQHGVFARDLAKSVARVPAAAGADGPGATVGTGADATGVDHRCDAGLAMRDGAGMKGHMKVEIAWGDILAHMFLGAHNRQFRSSSARGVRVVRHFKTASLRRKYERGEISHVVDNLTDASHSSRRVVGYIEETRN